MEMKTFSEDKKYLYEKKNYLDDGSLQSIIQLVDHSHERKMMNKKFFFVPFWLIILFIALVVAILIIIVATFYINFSERHGLYTESCKRRSCTSGLNLACRNEICSCSSNQYYNKGCFDKRNYSESCMGNASYCVDGKNLYCLDGVCKCNNKNYWGGFSCVSKSSYGEFCKNNNECLVIPQSTYCNLLKNKCACSTDRYI